MELFINGEKAVKGQYIETFRGEKAMLLSWREPHKISSSGHVYIREIETGNTGEYYPGVINGKFE